MMENNCKEEKPVGMISRTCCGLFLACYINRRGLLDQQTDAHVRGLIVVRQSYHSFYHSEV